MRERADADIGAGSTRKNTEVHADLTPPKKAAALELKVTGAGMETDHLSHSAAARATSGWPACALCGVG